MSKQSPWLNERIRGDYLIARLFGFPEAVYTLTDAQELAREFGSTSGVSAWGDFAPATDDATLWGLDCAARLFMYQHEVSQTGNTQILGNIEAAIEGLRLALDPHVFLAVRMSADLLPTADEADSFRLGTRKMRDHVRDYLAGLERYLPRTDLHPHHQHGKAMFARQSFFYELGEVYTSMRGSAPSDGPAFQGFIVKASQLFTNSALPGVQEWLTENDEARQQLLSVTGTTVGEMLHTAKQAAPDWFAGLHELVGTKPRTYAPKERQSHAAEIAQLEGENAADKELLGRGGLTEMERRRILLRIANRERAIREERRR